MKPFLILLLAAASLMAATGHRFLCTDYTQGKVFIVGADGKVEWSYDAPFANDIWQLPNGNLLFNTGHGVKEVTVAKQVVFSYESPSAIYACQRLPNGNTFVGECNAGRLLEVNPAGKIVKQIRLLPEGQDGGPAYMRNARRLANGNFLVSALRAGSGSRIRPAGEGSARDSRGRRTSQRHTTAQREYADRLGRWRRSAGARLRGRSRRQDRLGGQGRRTAGHQPEVHVGVQRLPNGNTVMSNWLGHDNFGKAPHLIEITRDKKVVWTFADHVTMKTISSVLLLDVPGDAIRGEILH